MTNLSKLQMASAASSNKVWLQNSSSFGVPNLPAAGEVNGSVTIPHGFNSDKLIFNLWEHKYDSFQLGALVLFNEKKFQVQWKNKNPMTNWHSLNACYRLQLLKKEENGWELFRIISKK